MGRIISVVVFGVGSGCGSLCWANCNIFFSNFLCF